jgi:cytochrome c-type biogenesis protein CcmE
MSSTPHDRPATAKRLKFIIGGVVIVAAITFLIISSTINNAQYFLTIDELLGRGTAVQGQAVRISGAVVGSTIQYDPQSLNLTFTIANIPADNNLIEEQGGLAAALHAAVIDPSRTRLQVVYHGPRPDLLNDEAQAIVTGHLGTDGTFYADELLLKCPTRYEDSLPAQAETPTT